MGKKRQFQRVTFIRPNRRATENLRPPYSEALRLELEQNAEAVARVTCLDLAFTMGLPAAALAPLQISVERFFRGDLSPRIDEINLAGMRGHKCLAMFRRKSPILRTRRVIGSCQLAWM